MLGLTLNIWTDVKGISKNSGMSANPPSVSSIVTAKTTGKSVTGGTLRFTPSPANVNTSVSTVTTTKG